MSDVNLEDWRELELDEAPTGQWRYRVLSAYIKGEEQRVYVDWQWGPHDKNEAIAQARARFSFRDVGWEKFHRDSVRTRAR
jgi:hypothetical protein